MKLREELLELAKRAKKASGELATLGEKGRSAFLQQLAQELPRCWNEIKVANELDVAEGKRAGLTAALLDRLLLNETRFDAMCRGVAEVSTMSDPIGGLLSRVERPNGLIIEKRRVPIGVIAIIYEARPNVTVDSSVLCLRAGNAVILRGGTDARRTNRALCLAIRETGSRNGMPEAAVQMVESEDREAVRELVGLEGYIDLVIPRGGESLIRAVTDAARVPVIKHYKGVCHVFADESADFEKALQIVENGKCQRPGVCNAIETLLVHEKIATRFLPLVTDRLAARGVELRGDPRSREIIPHMKEALESDWTAEYLDLILAIRVVRDVGEAIDHINTYGSHHSDAIVTESTDSEVRFLQEVDSAAVYLNASTRFTDGGEFGLGAEIGISTDKLHARGPMGVEELTTYKYVIRGTGQVRA